MNPEEYKKAKNLTPMLEFAEMYGMKQERQRIVAILKGMVANGNKFMSMKDALNEAIAAIEAKEEHDKHS